MQDRTAFEEDVYKMKTRICDLEQAQRIAKMQLRQKQKKDKKFMLSQISEKIDMDAAMDAEEHEELITKTSKMATRAYLRKTLRGEVEDIVKNLLDERDAAIMGIIDAKADHNELGSESATMQRQIRVQGRQLREQGGQILSILQWIRDV